MFWNFLLGIALYFLQLVLAPKPQNAKPASLQDFNVPVAEEGKEIPVIFGTVNQKSPNVVWYGDLRLLPIKGPRRYGFFGPRQITGYKYGLGMHMVLCHAVHDEIREIWAGNKQIFPKPVTGAPFQGSGAIWIDQADIFGGDDGQGGILGSVHVLGGAPTQAQDSYLASVLAGSNTPAFRGVVSIVWEHIYIGNSPYIQPWEFVLKRIHRTSRDVEQWYDAKAAVPDDEFVASGGTDLDAGSIPGFNDFFSNADWATAVTSGNPDYDVYVWDVTTGDLRILNVVGNNTIGAYSYITDEGEIIVRDGGDAFGGTPTHMLIYGASDLGLIQTIDIAPYLTSTDLNTGFSISEVEVAGIKYLFVIVLPYIAFRGPYLVLKRVLGEWSVDQHLDSDGTTITGYDDLSVGTQYAYLLGSTTIGLVEWNGGFSESVVTPPGLSGLEMIYCSYIPATDEVLVVTGGTTGMGDTCKALVYDPTLTTLIRSGTIYNGFNFRLRNASDRLFIQSGIACIPVVVFGSFVIDSIILYDVNTMTVQETIPVNPGGSFVNQTGAFNYFVPNSQNGGVAVMPAGSPQHMSFWPLVAPDALDMNPAHIIRECLTDRTWGMGYADADIDDDSFTYAADVLYDERFGLSLQWTREERIEEFISVILSHIDAYLYLRRTTGKFYLKLIRNDYVLVDLPVFDEDDVVTWDEVSRREPPEAVNSVIVKYTDRRNRGKDAAHSYDNIAQIQQIGERISATRFYPGISRGSLAVRVAARDQRSLGIGMISGRLTGKRTWDSLYPGDPFRLITARHNLDGEVMRVAQMKFGDGRDNKIGLKFAQDVFRLNANELVDTAATDWENPRNPPSAVTPRLVWEMPYLELKQMIGPSDTGTLLSDDADAGMMEAAGGKPTGDALDAAIYVNGIREDVMTFAPTGLLDADIAAFDTAITLTDDTDIDSIEVGQLAAIIGTTTATTEIVKITAITGNDLTIARGMLDTIPQAHSLGDALVVFDDFGMSDFEARTAGDLLHVKLQTRTSGGVLSLALAPTDNVTLDSRAVRPLRPADDQLDGDDGSAGLVDLTGVNPIPATWARRNRLTDTGTLHWDGADQTPEGGQTTSLILLANDGTTVIDDTTYTGIAGTSQDIDPADFGAAKKGYVVFDSLRDGYNAWQAYRIHVQVQADVVLGADAGSYVLTGTAATLKKGKSLTAGAGSYAFTGTAATLTKGKSLTAAAGSYALTGTDATLTIPSGILDGTSPTGAWSMSRDLLSSFAGGTKYTTATGVDSWKDQTGNSRHFEQSIAGLQPTSSTAGPNSVACLDFDGGDDLMAQPSNNLGSLLTTGDALIIVSCIVDTIDSDNVNSESQSETIFGDNSGYLGMGLIATGSNAYAYNFDGNYDNVQKGIATATALVMTWRHTGGTLYISKNGGIESSVSSGNTGAGDMNTKLRIGHATGTTNSYLDGKIFEMATWNSGSTPDATTIAAIVADFMSHIGATTGSDGYTTLDGGTNVGMTLSSGDRTATHNNGSAAIARSPDFKSSGKYYVEYTFTTIINGNDSVGFADSTATATNVTTNGTHCTTVYKSGNIWANGAPTGQNIGTIANGDRIDWAIDFDNQKAWARRNGGNWNGDVSANPATNTNGAAIGSSAQAPMIGMDGAGSQVATGNFGASAFSGTVPSGFTSGWPV